MVDLAADVGEMFVQRFCSNLVTLGSFSAIPPVTFPAHDAPFATGAGSRHLFYCRYSSGLNLAAVKIVSVCRAGAATI